MVYYYLQKLSIYLHSVRDAEAEEGEAERHHDDGLPFTGGRELVEN